MFRFLCIIIILLLLSRVAAGTKPYIRSLASSKLVLVYSKRGSTGAAVRRTLGAELVTTACYSNAIGSGIPFCPVDLLEVDGRKLRGYRSSLRRPIVQICNEKGLIRIYASHAEFTRRREPGGTVFTGNYRLTDPKRRTARPYLGLIKVRKNGKSVPGFVLGTVYGTEAEAVRAMRKLKGSLGFSQHVWLDGGSAYGYQVRRGFHLAAVPRPAPLLVAALY